MRVAEAEGYVERIAEVRQQPEATEESKRLQAQFTERSKEYRDLCARYEKFVGFHGLLIQLGLQGEQHEDEVTLLANIQQRADCNNIFTSAVDLTADACCGQPMTGDKLVPQ
ncbi:hypothetical protein MMC08_004762 [Hypocenomyce scalaris]|nr:hypothetical protein [Hypocenomyce scalaris]